MIRSQRFHTLSALAVAMILPVAAYAVQGTTTASPVKPAARTAMHHEATPVKAMNASKTHSHAKRAAAVDINTASKEDLMALPGVTDEIAQKIIDARPFKSKAELVSKKVLTKAEYSKLRGRVIAKHEAKMSESKSMESSPEAKAPEAKAPDTKAPETTK